MLPTLVVVTGRPASGKSTLLDILDQQLKIKSLRSRNGTVFKMLSRDEVKVRFFKAHGIRHDEAPRDTNQQVTQQFIVELTDLIHSGNSVIIDAAFQQPLWEKVLTPLIPIAQVKIVICHVSAHVALARYENRLLQKTNWRDIHGDDTPTDLITGYQTPDFDLPTLKLYMQQAKFDPAQVLAFVLR